MELRSGHDEFGATCFTCAVFSVAVLSEMAPLVIAARESMLVVKTHAGASTPILGWSPGEVTVLGTYLFDPLPKPKVVNGRFCSASKVSCFEIVQEKR